MRKELSSLLKGLTGTQGCAYTGGLAPRGGLRTDGDGDGEHSLFTGAPTKHSPCFLPRDCPRSQEAQLSHSQLRA